MSNLSVEMKVSKISKQIGYLNQSTLYHIMEVVIYHHHVALD